MKVRILPTINDPCAGETGTIVQSFPESPVRALKYRHLVSVDLSAPVQTVCRWFADDEIEVIEDDGTSA